ncbi:hypothetical protein PAGL106935_26005 [Paenibacillus glucanolyticus]|jgi:hypothetical protein
MKIGPNLNNPLYLYEYGRIIIHIYETDRSMGNLLVREPQFNAGHGNIPNKVKGRLAAAAS